MSSNKGLTLSIIFEAESANYGEGYGNISSIKKISRGDGNFYTYISRQAMIYRLKNHLRWLDTTTDPQGAVAQYADSAKIDKYPEIDLFGYMKTKSKTKKDDDKTQEKDKGNKGEQKVRSAVARFSNAISLEPYRGDVDFGTNISLANRPNSNGAGLLPYNSEIHKAYYAYTITVDLDRVGVDPKDSINLDNENKIDRIIKLLEGVEFLNREIKGRVENMNPIFIIGGLYNIKNPFFENRLELNGKRQLEISQIKNVLESIKTRSLGETYSGCIKAKFDNGEEIEKELETINISDVFDALHNKVKKYYGV